jgi:hypothetical protein
MSKKGMALPVYLAPNINEGIRTKKDDMGGACSTCGRDVKYIQNYGQEI